MLDLSFYRGKKILITGHTGFKGSWLTKMLLSVGADVTGYSLDVPTNPSLFNILQLNKEINSIEGDIRDYTKLKTVFDTVKPEIVIHMAAQPLVRESYQNPVYTYETNVMGTVHVLECIRITESVKSFLNVTTDKVYKNCEWEWGYRENDELDGYDPYSNSKSCSELVTHSYLQSFFSDREIAISTARAGNVIGGGDFAADRIIPDCIRAAMKRKDIVVRNPYSTRPYQHVLEPLLAYMLIAKEQYIDIGKAGNYNVGPDECDCLTTGALVQLFCDKWSEEQGWIDQSDGGPHEAGYLKLDCSKIKRTFHWKPTWHIEEAMKKICDWSKAYMANENMNYYTEYQIKEFLEAFQLS